MAVFWLCTSLSSYEVVKYGYMEGIKNQKSFTLIELLIVIAIIAIIAGAILVAINPAKRIAEAQDSQRWSETNSILTAVNTYIVDNKGNVPSCGGVGDLPADGIYRWMGVTGGGGTWLMEGNPNDSSGNGKDGFAVGPLSYPIDAERGWVLELDLGEYIEVLDDDIFDITENLTIAAWVKPDVENVFQSIICKEYLSDWDCAYQLRSIGGVLPYDSWDFSITPDGDNYKHTVWGSFDPGTWYHIVGTYNGSNERRLYIDGNLETEIIEELGPILTTNDPLRIGTEAMNPWDFDGRIDEVIVFNYTLSANEVWELYDHGIYGDGIQSCNLAADLVATGGYLSSIPQDPSEGDDQNSGYLIKRDPSGVISVKAPHASDYAEQEIMVSR